MDPASLPNRPPAPNVTEPGRLADRARRRVETPIEFIANSAFDHPADGDQAAVVDALVARWQSAADSAGGSKTHLGRLCDAELLSLEQERALFCQMNYLKCQAERMRRTIDLEGVDAAVLDAIDRRLERARQIRDCIIQANMRLVLSIVRKFVTPQQTCDEMLSDGIVTLMQAVEKFDFDRGFRFSTYAYRSIARHAYRSVKAVRSEESRMVRDADEWAFEQDEDRPASSMHDRVWSQLRERMGMLLGQLDRRDRFIIRSRYALGAHRKAQSFQAIADRLGVSKERARQLERRAVEKLRQMTSERELDELFGAKLV
ncbi:sigma-70 family RNA polymerase sigma factor [Roseimaritima ulvae]|uniref:RNA polymerase sigma-28 factor n=1 Tax=Roseimaritima ulvae TaxID=980254 RepID=A0A5B9R3N6_9BACT|nr:sigma-70 family RNA polymerase sigma factor [Roseimaritima ulvae]QEG40961.1 RNA polymerase sigma-28 factor precursor [Roseimaritima ulvae]